MDVSQLEIIAPLLFVSLLTVTIGGVILLKPITRRLGDLLEAMAREKAQPQVGDQVQRVHELLETMNGRLTLLEERQDFTDALLNDPDRGRLRLRADASATPPDAEGSGPDSTE